MKFRIFLSSVEAFCFASGCNSGVRVLNTQGHIKLSLSQWPLGLGTKKGEFTEVLLSIHMWGVRRQGRENSYLAAVGL